MTRRAARGSTSGQRLAGLLLAAAVAGGLWYAWQNRATLVSRVPMAAAPAPGAASSPVRSDAAVRPPAAIAVSDVARGASPLRDGRLGVTAPAGPLALVRVVELLQWQERCADGRCDYAKAWSAGPVDSAAFRERKGHENTGRLPFKGETFVAADVRLGALKLDPALVPRLPLEAAIRTPLAIRVSQLPPNLAATFRERDGALYAGDPARPAIGDLRVRYVTLALDAPQRIEGVKDGDRLRPASH